MESLPWAVLGSLTGMRYLLTHSCELTAHTDFVFWLSLGSLKWENLLVQCLRFYFSDLHKCCVTVSSRSQHFTLQGSSLNKKINNSKEFQEVPRFPMPLPTRVRKKSCESPSEEWSQTSERALDTRAAAWKKQKAAEWVAWKRLDQPGHVERTPSNLWAACMLYNMLQFISFHELSLMLR